MFPSLYAIVDSGAVGERVLEISEELAGRR